MRNILTAKLSYQCVVEDRLIAMNRNAKLDNGSQWISIGGMGSPHKGGYGGLSPIRML
jgi:hypothetical protein